MNQQQAAQAMAVLASTYSKTIDPEQMSVWFGSCLEKCPVDIAREAVAVIIRDDQFFPTPARFNEVRRAVERAHEPSVQALPPAPRTDQQVDRVKQIIAETRAQLRGTKA